MRFNVLKFVFIILLFIGVQYSTAAQERNNQTDADVESYRLYSEMKWVELLQYGKSVLSEGVDFPLLRMRIGYAAYMTGKFSESLKQYQVVLKDNEDNASALLYCYWNSLYLNQQTLARFYYSKMSESLKASENITLPPSSSIELEYSYKLPTAVTRFNGSYMRAGVSVFVNDQLRWDNSVTSFSQIINESLLTSVNSNANINVAQKGLVSKVAYTPSANMQWIGGVHYLQSTLNNLTYQNIIGIAGIKYIDPYFNVQGFVQSGILGDSSYTQLNASLTIYPNGNTNLYLSSDLAISKKQAFTQTLGFGVTKKCWLETRATLGRYNKLFMNDALYIYDDIDTKKLRLGTSLYYWVSKNVALQAHYTYDQKELYQRTGITYNQFSITGGIQWKF